MSDVTETATTKPGRWRDLLGRERLGTATSAGWRRRAVRDQRIPHHQPVAEHRRRHRRAAVLRMGHRGVPGRFGGRGDHGQPAPRQVRAACVVPADVGPLRRGHGGLRPGAEHGTAAGRPHRAGRGGRNARRPRLCGDQLRAAELAVDKGVCVGVGDVGRSRDRRSRVRRHIRPIRYLALGFRLDRAHDSGDGRTRARCVADAAKTVSRSRCDPRIPRIPLWSLLLLGSAALAISIAGVQHSAAGHLRAARGRRGAGRAVPGGGPAGAGDGVAAGGVRSRAAEVDVRDRRTADGGHDGRHVRAAVRPAAGRHGACRGGILRCRAGGRAGRPRRSPAHR